MNRNINGKGFTLVEILVAIAVLAVLVVVGGLNVHHRNSSENIFIRA